MSNLYNMKKRVSSLNDLIDGYAAIFAGATNVFYVDAQHANSSDANEGTDPNKPMKKITAAYGRCTDGLSDLIVVKGGVYRYREGATLSIEKDGVTILGSGWGCEWNNNGLAGGYVVKVLAKNVKIANIQISVNDSGSGIYVGDGAVDANASLCTIENCFVRGDWLTETGPGAGILKGIEVDGASLATIRNNHIWGWGTGVDVSDGSDRTSYGAHIYDNKILSCQDYGIKWTGIGYTSIIDNNTITDFSASVTMTYAVSLNITTGSVVVCNNTIAAANPVYDAGNLNLWVGNKIHMTYAASENLSLAQAANDATVT